MAHARLSPSSAGRWMGCAAAPSREAGLPDVDSESSKLGTNAHAYLEAMLLAGDPRAVPKVLPHPDVPVDVNSLLGAASCYGYAIDRQKELKADLAAESKCLPGKFTGRDDGDGTGDITLVSKRFLEIVDYKNGGRYVDARDPQFKIYALGKMAEHVDKKGNIPFDTVRLTVYQPKRPGVTATERYIEMTPQDLLDWCAQEYIPKAAATDAASPAATPSDETCHYCKAQDTCPERGTFMEQRLEILFPMDSITRSGGDPLLCSVPVEQLTPAQLADVLDAAPLVEARIKDVRKRSTDLAHDRQAPPRWKLVQGSGQRKWNGTPEEMAEFFKTTVKLKLDQYMPRDLVSPAQCEKLGLHLKKWKQIQERILVQAGGLSLVPATDPRPDAKPSVEGQFADLTERPSAPVFDVAVGPFAGMAAPFGPAAVLPEAAAEPAPMDLSFLGL